MINHIDIANVLFLDIETVSAKTSYYDLSDTFKELWGLKAKGILRKYDEPIEEEELAQHFFTWIQTQATQKNYL